MIDAASAHRKDPDSLASEEEGAKELRRQIAALESERDRLRAVLAAVAPQDGTRTPDYQWHVEMAAKGMAERDSHPMPVFATTPKAFYGVMAGAALEAIGLPDLLERVERAEQELNIPRRTVEGTDVNSERTRRKPRRTRLKFRGSHRRRNGWRIR
jgi:hypothetical protein